MPPLQLERRIFLSRRFNAYFSHGDAQLFLARRDGRVVGRISAQYDDAFNAHHGNRWGMFGFLELEDDPEILPALLDAAEQWLLSRGRDHMIGPMDFTMNDESGVMIEGFDRVPMIKQPWHPPYYRQRSRGGRPAQGDGPAHVGAADLRPREDPARHLQARRRGRAAARHPPAQDDAPLAAQGHGPLRRRLQLGLERELGLLALLQEGPRRLHAGAAARLRRSTGSWSPRPPRARPRRSRSRCPTSTRSWPR